MLEDLHIGLEAREGQRSDVHDPSFHVIVEDLYDKKISHCFTLSKSCVEAKV